jgi:hypothetical protein
MNDHRSDAQRAHDEFQREVMRGLDEKVRSGRLEPGFIVGGLPTDPPTLPPANISGRWSRPPESWTGPAPSEPTSSPTPIEPPQPRDPGGRFTRSKRTNTP